MSENSTLPNLSYFSAGASFRLDDKQVVSLGGLQSLDPVEKRTLPTPFGHDMVLPGEVLTSHYQYQLAPLYFLEAREVYVNTFHFFDPFVGVSYRNRPELGWGQRVGLSAAIPVTPHSISENEITKLYLRAVATYKTTRWTSSVGVGHAHNFYATPPENMVVRNRQLNAGVGSGSDSGAGSGAGQNSDEKPKSLSDAPQMIDFILGDHEVSRSSVSGGTAYIPGRHWKVGCSTSLSLIETVSHRQVWFSSAQPVSATYSFSNWELGSAFTMTSNIEDYKSPPLPTLWNLSLRLGFKLGTRIW
jgi:hypothetical protein